MKRKDLSDYADFGSLEAPDARQPAWNEDLPGPAEAPKMAENAGRTSGQGPSPGTSGENRRRIKVTVRHPEALETAAEATGFSRSQLYSLAFRQWADRQGFLA